MNSRNILAAFMLFCVIMLFVTPFLEPYGTFTELDGVIGRMDHSDLWGNVNVLSGLVYGVGDMLCHQTFSRSLVLNGSQVAICIRDLGAAVGLTAGLFAVRFVPREYIIERRMLAVIIVLFVPVIIDWSVQFATGFDSSLTRAVTGALAGIAAALFIERALLRMYDPPGTQTI